LLPQYSGVETNFIAVLSKTKHNTAKTIPAKNANKFFLTELDTFWTRPAKNPSLPKSFSFKSSNQQKL
jgi:hypothetical protein